MEHDFEVCNDANHTLKQKVFFINILSFFSQAPELNILR